MKIQVIDIGNTSIKFDVWEIGKDTPKLLTHYIAGTSRDMKENLEIINRAYDITQKDGTIILSMSDSTVYETPEGSIRWLPAQEPTHPYARLDSLPAYRETGKPHREILSGILNQMQMIKTQMNTRGFRHKVRILPMSGFVASWLAGDKSFRSWDITHASNSGVFNYQIANLYDPRYPMSGWHACINDILDAGYIDRKILRCDHVFKTVNGPILLGGHDTTFANGMHGIYSAKPYISCGTWLTVSTESDISRNWKDEGARYLVAPNSSILKQICFPSPTESEGLEGAARRVNDFISKHLILETQSPIRIFGPWREVMCDKLAAISEYKFFTTRDHHLSEQAALYAHKALK